LLALLGPAQIFRQGDRRGLVAAVIASRAQATDI
jgi:hypothetical protein